MRWVRFLTDWRQPWRWLRGLSTARKTLLISCGVVLAFCACLQFLPLPASIHHQPYASILLARDGNLLGASIAADQQWRFAPVTGLPQKYQRALLQFEDRYFYLHPGINPFAILRAAKGNIAAGKITSGGSTITMQLARLLRQQELARAGIKPGRTLASKLAEAFLALQLEWLLDKDEILAAYASQAPFGGNIVGLRAAAWRYFGRAPDHLSWAESALLAVLPNSPALIHPGRQRDQLQQKRNRLLRKLHQQQWLSDLDLQLALLEPLPERPQALPQLAPHLLATLKQQDPAGKLFQSTLDFHTQQLANKIAQRHSARLAKDGVHNLALVLIDHQQMELVAYVGNQAFNFLPAASGSDPAARSPRQQAPDVDIIQRPRSTGSLLKPLLYGLMLQQGELAPTTLVPDIPTQINGYSPRNYDRSFRGAVPAQFALAHSLNIPAVRMLRDYGIARFHGHLQTMGITSLFRPPDDYGLTLILGGAEASLWELTSVYARLAAAARDGDKAQPPVQSLVSDANTAGKKISYKPVIKQGAAWLTLQALIEVARPGNDNYWRDFAGSQTIAWKTGTSYGLRDGWAIGSNGRYTLGVWVGNAGGEPATFISGQSSAAPILFDMFDALPRVNWFAKPEHALKTIAVCADDGYLASGQCATRDVQIPAQSHFEKITPFHRRIHLSSDGQFRVHNRCETVSNMQARDWFVLPPAQEFYWRQYHSDYQSLPPWRRDCLAESAQQDEDTPMELIYPQARSRIYIPVALDGKRSRVILKAVHRDPAAVLYWHLDDQYLGETKLFHEREAALEPGLHQLLIIDKQGYRLERRFRVVGKSSAP